MSNQNRHNLTGTTVSDGVHLLRREKGYTAALTPEAAAALGQLDALLPQLGLNFAYAPPQRDYIRWCSVAPDSGRTTGEWLAFDIAQLGNEQALQSMVTRSLYDSHREAFEKLGCTADESSTNFSARSAGEVENGDVYLLTFGCQVGVTRVETACPGCGLVHAGECG